ncbi:MAG: hypothetical protein ABI416_01735 [Ginsengibacter sp.]
MKHIYLIISFLLYAVCFFILFPYNRFNIDSDGIAYIQEARQYAWGNYFTALNGCWSPLLSWMLIPFIKAGCDPVVCCKYINGFIGACSLFSFYALSQKFYIKQWLKPVIPLAFAIFTLSSAFKLLGPDGLQTFLLSLYLNLIFSRRFIYSRPKLLLCGLLGALCYYAKSYNFFFFIIHISIVIFLLCRKARRENFFKFYLSKITMVFIAFVIFSAPYIILLTNKYQQFTISSATSITVNKSLEPFFTDGRKLVVAPANPQALAIADDPTYFQQHYITPFTSANYFFKQVKITIWNIFDYTRLLNEISIFAITILLAFSIYLYHRSGMNWQPNEVFLLITAILYPSGYLLIALEWRYIWLIPVVLLLMAAILVSKISIPPQQKNLWRFVTVIAIFSFFVKPIRELKENISNKPWIYNATRALKQHGIAGNFFGPNADYVNASRNYYFCYLNNSRLFGVFTRDYTTSEILDAAIKYQVKYFFNYYDTPAEKEYILRSALAAASVKVYDSLYTGIIVFQIAR